MTDFTSVSIPKPKDWQAFERHARLLFEKSLGDPAVQNNGRPGQRQHGVDIFGRRGGAGPLVGVQCKGKQEDYARAVTEAEVTAEVEKTNAFVPPLDEFILITTAPDDAVIQRAVRILEQEVRTKGRNLSIQVWGWGRVEQEITRFPEAIREFHPDATPFTGAILDQIASVKRLVADGQDVQATQMAAMEQRLLMAVGAAPKIAPDPASAPDTLDKEWNIQIDGYRELLRGDQPRTAIKLLEALKDRICNQASDRIKYRILANIGAAYYNLGEYERASDYLLEAAPLDPEDPRSVANKSAALLIKGRKDEARQVAIAGLQKHPDNPDIALQRLQTLSADETMDDVWDALPDSVKANGIAHGQRVFVLREAGDPRWRKLLEEARAKFPDDHALKMFWADSLVDRMLSIDPGAVGKVGASVPTPRELSDAVSYLTERWKASLQGERGPNFAHAHNAAVALNILGETSEAAELLDTAFARGCDMDQSKQLRISLYRKQGKVAEAIKMADTLTDSPISRIIRADLRTEIAPEQVREILAERSAFPREVEQIAAALSVLESYLGQGNHAEAEKEAERLRAALPNHPQGALALFRVKRFSGDQDAGLELDRALALVSADTDFPTRFLVCEALASAQRYADIPDLLLGHTSTNFDSPALRMLLAAAINVDMRVTVRQLLGALPSEVASRLYYQKIKIAQNIHTGDSASAERSIKAFLEREPSNLEMHLQLLNAQFRRNDLEQMKKSLAAPASAFKGSAEDFLRLAQFKDSFGNWHDGLHPVPKTPS